MVESLVSLGPLSFDIFNNMFALDKQKALAMKCFDSLKTTEHNKKGKGGNKGYFETTRNFTSLVPLGYLRTANAPRLTVRDNTLHGMNKALVVEILKQFTSLNKQCFIIEIDMSAMHSRVAASLLPENSMLQKSLEDPSFWKTQVNRFLPLYEHKNINMTFDILKRVLKVQLYTSLNGGNPGSRDRLIDNLTGNAKVLLPKKHLTSSDLYLITKSIADNFELVNEVKNVNKMCFMKAFTNSWTYTLDRPTPYRNEADYKGISKVLQGFEVVLLSCLVQFVIEQKGLPLSLDHDGLLAMFVLNNDLNYTNDYTNDMIKEDVNEILTNLTLKMNSWSNYLLKGTVPIEAKRFWFQSNLYEF